MFSSPLEFYIKGTNFPMTSVFDLEMLKKKKVNTTQLHNWGLQDDKNQLIAFDFSTKGKTKHNTKKT